MATMSFGFHYDIGVRVGYNLSFGKVRLSNVSSKDKSKIIREIKDSGYKRSEIIVERVSH